MPPKSKGSALHSLLIWRVWTKKIRSAKQCQSVVRQAGKVGMMCELDGVTGWDFDFRGHKLHGDWQAALGVTLSRVAEMGYENVQITPPAFTTAAELAKLLKTKGLKADSAICTVYKIPENIEQISRDAEALETCVLRTDLPEGTILAQMPEAGTLFKLDGEDDRINLVLVVTTQKENTPSLPGLPPSIFG
jgi:hypothetical protein